MAKVRRSHVKGVYERPAGSNNWSVRYRVGERWVRKSFGQDRAAAIAYAEKARTISRSGEGVLPTTAREHVLTFRELGKKASTVTVADIADDYLAYVKAHPSEYKDQLNPQRVVKQVKEQFGTHCAATL